MACARTTKDFQLRQNYKTFSGAPEWRQVGQRDSHAQRRSVVLVLVQLPNKSKSVSFLARQNFGRRADHFYSISSIFRGKTAGFN